MKFLLAGLTIDAFISFKVRIYNNDLRTQYHDIQLYCDILKSTITFLIPPNPNTYVYMYNM